MGSRGTEGSGKDAKKKQTSVIAATPRKKTLKLNKTVLFPQKHTQRLKAQGITPQYKFVFKEENSLEALVRT